MKTDHRIVLKLLQREFFGGSDTAFAVLAAAAAAAGAGGGGGGGFFVFPNDVSHAHFSTGGDVSGQPRPLMVHLKQIQEKRRRVN